MASTKTVTASLVIDFSQAAGEGILVAEVDDRETGYNAGDTNFGIGSEPVILVYKTTNVVIDRIATSEGSLSLIAASEVIAVDEYLTYANEKSASPEKPIQSGSSSITDTAGVVGTPSVSESAVSFSTPQIGVLKIGYNTVAQAYKLTGAAGTRPVVIYIAGHTT